MAKLYPPSASLLGRNIIKQNYEFKGWFSVKGYKELLKMHFFFKLNFINHVVTFVLSSRLCLGVAQGKNLLDYPKGPKPTNLSKIIWNKSPLGTWTWCLLRLHGTGLISTLLATLVWYVVNWNSVYNAWIVCLFVRKKRPQTGPWVHLWYKGLIVQSGFFGPLLTGSLSIYVWLLHSLSNLDKTNKY